MRLAICHPNRSTKAASSARWLRRKHQCSSRRYAPPQLANRFPHSSPRLRWSTMAKSTWVINCSNSEVSFCSEYGSSFRTACRSHTAKFQRLSRCFKWSLRRISSWTQFFIVMNNRRKETTSVWTTVTYHSYESEILRSTHSLVEGMPQSSRCLWMPQRLTLSVSTRNHQTNLQPNRQGRTRVHLGDKS